MRLDLSSVFSVIPHEPHWIVKNIIPAGTIVLVAGDAGVGKSVMNLAEGLHIALGRPFLGHDTCQTRVLFFDEENSKPDLSSYLQQLWVGLGRPPDKDIEPWFRLEHFSLGSNWRVQMAEIVAEWQPGMIYVDTATSALQIRDENDNAEAQRAVQGLRYVMRAAGTNAALKIIKHAKFQTAQKGEERPRRTIRGAKAWLGAVDQTMYHIALKGRPPQHGLRPTMLIPDKSRAFGLKTNILISPAPVEGTPKGLILQGKVVTGDKDYLLVDA